MMHTDDLLHAHLDGELTAAERVELWECALSDPRFAHRLAEMELARARLQTPRPEEEAAPDLVASVLAAWEPETVEPSNVESLNAARPAPMSPVAARWPYAAAAGLALALGVAFYLARPGEFTNAEQPVPAVALADSNSAPLEAGKPAQDLTQVAVAPAQETDALTPGLVRFVYAGEQPRMVALAGDFNDWKPERTLLRPTAKKGLWSTTLRLPPGTYEYMFVVDGSWVTDPSAERYRDDGFGNQNAVIEL